MSDELKAAAKRLFEGQYYGDGGNLIDAIRARKADGELVARAYLADLAAREAEERERALPIDEEWLQSLGFEYIPSHMGPEYGYDMQLDQLEIWDFNGQCWLMIDADWFEMTTRGHILDLMRVTGTTKGGGV